MSSASQNFTTSLATTYLHKTYILIQTSHLIFKKAATAILFFITLKQCRFIVGPASKWFPCIHGYSVKSEKFRMAAMATILVLTSR